MAESNTDRTRYPSHPLHVRAARHHAEQVLSGWGIDEATQEAVVLVAEELASNAVLHISPSTGREFGLTLRMLQTVIRVEVRDADPNLPVLHALAEDANAESGRGLLIVERLSASWGTSPEVLGKTVWADIALHLDSAPACPEALVRGTA